MFVKIDDKTIINTDQVRLIEVTENGEAAFIYLGDDPEKPYTLIQDEARAAWEYFNSIVMTPGERKQEKPEQMSRREAERFIDFGDHKSSCYHWGSKTGWECNCEYPQLLEQAQSILEQSE